MNQKTNQPEVWLRGPLKDIPDLLQPAAHALQQTQEDLRYLLSTFNDELLWEKPAGRASIGFHLQHITGVLDRMITYAKEEKLSENQFEYLRREGIEDLTLTAAKLLQNFDDKMLEAIHFFKEIDKKLLLKKRVVGRKELPSTVLGLLFHAAEHSQRHLGQLLVTVSILEYPK